MNTQDILDYETKGLTLDDTVLLFTDLIETGDIWKLPTSYLDIAASLIEHGQLPTTNKETLQ